MFFFAAFNDHPGLDDTMSPKRKKKLQVATKRVKKLNPDGSCFYAVLLRNVYVNFTLLLLLQANVISSIENAVKLEEQILTVQNYTIEGESLCFCSVSC